MPIHQVKDIPVGQLFQATIKYKPGAASMKIATNKPRYSRETHVTYEGLDMFPILEQLSAPATWMWWKLAQLRNETTNVTILRSGELSIYERRKLTKGFKELKTKQLIKRIKREHYLINPNALLPEENYKKPDESNYLTCLTRWESLP